METENSPMGKMRNYDPKKILEEPVFEDNTFKEVDEATDKLQSDLFSWASNKELHKDFNTTLNEQRAIINQHFQRFAIRTRNEVIEEIKLAFKKTFRGAGELWFDYKPSNEEERKNIENELEEYWQEILENLSSLKRE